MVVQACCRTLLRGAREWAASAAPPSGLRWKAATSMGQQHWRCFSHRHSLQPTKWRYEADEVVTKMAGIVKEGISTNTCGLTLNTARPVSPDMFEDALVHLCRKVESLQVSLPERDGHLWVAEMDTPKIDFQVMKDGNFEDLIKTTPEAPYNLAEGPLWRARLLVCPPDEPCKLPEIKDVFPHQYHLAIDVHHSINDAVSLMAITQTFFTILDSLLDGTQIDDKKIGELRDRTEARAAEKKIKETLEKDPQRLKVLLEERYKLHTGVSLFTEAFGDPQESCPATSFQDPRILNDKLLQVFNAKCKAHKVTFNSGFVSVMNVALLELVREAGVVRDSYMISTRHPVDTRRYMSDVKSMVWGYHGIPMTQTMKTPWNVGKDFWKYVVDFDAKFRCHINNMGPLEERILDTMLQLPTSDHKNKVIYDFFFSNVYSPRIKPYGSGKHVQLTNVYNYIPLTQLDYGILCGVAKFRDNVRFQLFNSSGYITAENAAKFSDKVISVFNDLAK